MAKQHKVTITKIAPILNAVKLSDEGTVGAESLVSPDDIVPLLSFV